MGKIAEAISKENNGNIRLDYIKSKLFPKAIISSWFLSEVEEYFGLLMEGFTRTELRELFEKNRFN